MVDRAAVLIVEDDERWQSVLKELLEDEGYDVTVMDAYQYGRQALQKDHFDLVIVDLELDELAPTLDGERLLNLMSRKYPGTPRIVVSGKGDPRIVRDVIKKYYAEDYIAKSHFDIQDFLQVVRKALACDPVEGTGTLSVDREGLRHLLEKHFNLQEIKDLCFDLQIDFDDLPSEGKKSREIIAYCQRHGRLEELQAMLAQLRPGIV